MEKEKAGLLKVVECQEVLTIISGDCLKAK